MSTATRETATKIYETHDGADCEFCGALCPDDAAALIDAIDKAISDERAAKWLPIESAPKDGTEILGWREDSGVFLMRWDAPENFLTDSECEALGDSAAQYDWFAADFVAGCRLENDLTPTLWTPMPQPVTQQCPECDHAHDLHNGDHCWYPLPSRDGVKWCECKRVFAAIRNDSERN